MGSIARSTKRYIQRSRIEKAVKITTACPVCGCSMKLAWWSWKTHKCPMCKTMVCVPWLNRE